VETTHIAGLTLKSFGFCPWKRRQLRTSHHLIVHLRRQVALPDRRSPSATHGQRVKTTRASCVLLSFVMRRSALYCFADAARGRDPMSLTLCSLNPTLP
jgi:hypothetical protein